MTDKPDDAEADALKWKAVAGWEAPARLRRQRELALSPDERLALVEEMIRMAIAAGTFRPRAPH